MILHHWKAAAILLEETVPASKVHHLCEYMLLIDKVKDVGDMFELWNRLTANHYHDFSAVFLHENVSGWRKTLKLLVDEEEECRRQQQNGKNVEDINYSACIFESESIEQRKLQALMTNENVSWKGNSLKSMKLSNSYLSNFYFSKLFNSQNLFL